jgi:hypothetical protein
MSTDDNQVRLIFRPLRDSVPWPSRVRRLLRYALRACKLRCERVEGLPEIDSNREQEETKS